MELLVMGMWGPYPAPGGACSGYLVSTESTRILLEAGNGVLSRLPGGIGCNIDAIVVSHLHWDHMSDLMVLRYALDATRKTVPLYCPAEPERESGLLDYKGVYRRYAPTEGESILIGDIEVSFHRVDHHILTYGLRLRAGERVLAYSADTGPTDALSAIARGADVFLCEANLAEGHEAPGHMKASQAARFARDAGVGSLLLTHVLPTLKSKDLEGEARKYFASTLVACEGCTYAIGGVSG